MDFPKKLKIFSQIIPIGLVSIAMGLCIAFAVYAGPDMTWDLRNYHFYSGYAALTGQGSQNLWPAQIQSWFNPTLDTLNVALIFVVPPKFVAATLGLLQSLVIPLLYLLARQTLRISSPQKFLALLAILSTLVGATGPMFLDQLGTGYGDVLTAIPILVALILLAHAILTRPPNKSYLRYVTGAGFILGVSCGLKPTNFIYAPGITFIVLFAERLELSILKSSVIPALGVLSGASLLGFLVADGSWAWHLWQQTGNPLFPFLNSIFHSPLISTTSQTLDQRFAPHSLKAFIEFPFRAALGFSPGSLIFYQDPRVACLIVFLGLIVLRRRWQSRWPSLLLGFFFITYILWLFVFGVERYIVGLELLSGILIVSLLSQIVGQRLAVPTTLIIAISLFALTGVPPKKFSGERGDWESVGLNGNWFKVTIPDTMETGAGLYLLMGDSPLSFIIPFFPPDATFIGMNGNLMSYASPIMEMKKHQMIDSYAGKLFAIGDGNLTEKDRIYLESYGLSITQPCGWITSATNFMQVCALHKYDKVIKI